MIAPRSHGQPARQSPYDKSEKGMSISSSSDDSLLSDHGLLPSPSRSGRYRSKRYFHRTRRTISELALLLIASIGLLALVQHLGLDFPWPRPSPPSSPSPGVPGPTPDFIKEGIRQCEIISRPTPSHKPYDHKRKKSDRFVAGTRDVWLRNATLWTGNKGGEEVIYGAEVYLSGGVVHHVGNGTSGKKDFLKKLGKKHGDVEEIDLHGAWVTPGIVDMHSHMGVDSSPELRGSDDTNSLKSPILPWLRSLDGFNTHDLAFNLSISGGITTMMVLPGSAGNIGGQAFLFKPRWTAENTPQSMQVESPFGISKHGGWERKENTWRHIKHACGENPARVYGNTRMDSAYDFRRAYTEGKELKDKQDRWCESPKTQSEPFPTSLEWEVLADVIRGNVKVNIHCYETTDLNTLVRISNEFKFPIAAFHHAHETYLVPDLLKSAYGKEPPAVALFATNARYKREAYRGSEFAPKILADAGIRVSMKSDHPVLDSRYLVYEAAQAHHYGLNFSHAMSSVTSHSAKSLGVDHRLGYVRAGYDADLVVWDSFPLSLGATPKQTYIDGIPQIARPYVVDKPKEAHKITEEGKWEKQIEETLAARGDPDLRPKEGKGSVVFMNVAELYRPERQRERGVRIQAEVLKSKGGMVVVTNGEITCVGECEVVDSGIEVIDLKGGSITPGLTTVGSYVGLMEIRQEKSTWDGVAYDPTQITAEIVDGVLAHGVDGAQFGGKDELLAYRSGVTKAVAYPISSSLISGLSYSFSTSALHPLSPNAILDPSAALHISLTGGGGKISTSTKLAILRRLLTSPANNGTEIWQVMDQVKHGQKRVVVEVNKADTIAALIRLKRDWAPGMKMTILGGQEAWMIAEDPAREDIGVIVAPARAFPSDWDNRRILPGPPLSNHTLASYLTSQGVLVGLGINEEWMARNTRNDAAWVYANNPEVFSKGDALALVSSNLDVLLGLGENSKTVGGAGWVAWEGDWTGFGGRVRAVRSAGGDKVDLF